MPLPKALQKQVEDANKLHEEVYGGKSAKGSVAPFPGMAPAQEQAVQEQQEPDVEAAPSQEETNEAPIKNDEETWEQRYKSLQGRVDKNLKELKAENEKLTKELDSTQYILSSIGNASPSQEQAKSAPTGLSDEDIEPYGRDMYEFIRRVADDRAGAMLANIQQENAKIQQQIGSVATKVTTSQTDQYRAAVLNLVPNYPELLKDPLFIDWLDEIEPTFGVPRGFALQDAADKFDASRTAAIFNQYLQSQSGSLEDSKVPPQLKTSAKAGSSNNLDQFIAPGTPRTPVHKGSADASSSEEEGDRIYTSREVQKFYDDVVKGKYRKNPELKERKERRIHKAMATGRYRP